MVKHQKPVKTVRRLRLICLMLVLVLCGCVKGSKGNDLVVFSGSTMGTTYTVKVFGFPDSLDPKQIQNEIETLLEQINRSMSSYIPESELFHFNRSQGGSPFPVSRELLGVLTESLRISELTDGALDITVAPLVNLWGFGVGSQSATVPSDQKIKSLIKKTGYQKIEIRQSPPAISKKIPELMIDLSSIAKGYGVDRVSLLIESKGVTGYLVEIGGEIRTGGTKAGQTPWIVGIERPLAGQRSIQQVVAIGDHAMATSGDYRNYFEKDGKRYSHLIDPASGKPVKHRLASVSVIHASCMTADALATAFMVMGAERAYSLAQRENLAAYFLVRSSSGFDVKSTTAFQAFLVKN